MYVVCVHVRVAEGGAEAFVAATEENARQTRREAGNLRFDILRDREDGRRFLLYEVYRDAGGMEAHKQTAHYAAWREAPEPWMAEPRRGVKYESLSPEGEEAWQTLR